VRPVERGEGPLHLHIRHHGAKFVVEAAEEGEDELSITDRIAELTKGGGHHLKAAAVVRDGEGALLEGVELSLQQ
jgi:hypothetical protein